MGKLVRKFLVDDIWNIGKIESWFTDMASEGLHLKSLGRVFATFEKGEPMKTKYRIDVLNNKHSEEQLNIYKECGWDFVTSVQDFYIFSSPESSNSPELHTDPAEQSYTLLDLDKRLRNNSIIISIAMLFFFGMMFYVLFLDSKLFLSMVEGRFIQQILLLIVELYVFYTVIRNYVAIHKLRKSLLKGKPIDHRENWRKSNLINKTANIFFMTIAVIAIILPLVSIAKSENYTLPETEVDLPIVRLSDVEQNPKLQRKDGYFSKGVDWGNRVSYDWSPLAPVQYEVEEQGIVEGQMWEGENREYSPSIRSYYYKLVFPQMASRIIDELMGRYIYEPGVIPEQIEDTPFDIMYAADDSGKKIFAAWDDNVIYIAYHGNKDIEQVIAAVSRMAFK